MYQNLPVGKNVRATYKVTRSLIMKAYEPTKRQVEIDRLKLAIKKTAAAQCRAQETLYKLHEKREGQKAELLLQTLLAKFDEKVKAI